MKDIHKLQENIQHFKKIHFLTFFGSFLPTWIRFRIRITNVDLDPDPLH